MSWLGILKLLLSLAGSVAKIVADRQLISAGEAQAVAEGLRNATDTLDKARRRIDAVRSDPDELERLRRRFRGPDKP